MKFGEIVLDGKDLPDWAVIYIIKERDELLYIGRSGNVGPNKLLDQRDRSAIDS